MEKNVSSLRENTPGGSAGWKAERVADVQEVDLAVFLLVFVELLVMRRREVSRIKTVSVCQSR